jgi:hypothetical protein
MKLSYPAVALIAVLAACNPASAQSTTDILQRLEALEKSNADLKKENAALVIACCTAKCVIRPAAWFPRRASG